MTVRHILTAAAAVASVAILVIAGVRLVEFIVAN